MIWFLLIVFLSPTGDAYLHGNMLPRVAPSEKACMFKKAAVEEAYSRAKALDPTMDDADVLCWQAEGHEGIRSMLNERYGFGSQPV